jgi:hypothetical protein
MAGIDLFHGFMKRNSDLSIRTPEGCILCWATSLNCHVSTFFIRFEEVIHNFPAHSDGMRIFSLDETIASTVPENIPKVLTQKRIKQVPQATSGE